MVHLEVRYGAHRGVDMLPKLVIGVLVGKFSKGALGVVLLTCASMDGWTTGSFAIQIRSCWFFFVMLLMWISSDWGIVVCFSCSYV